MRYQGKIVRWNDERGFGFAVPNGGNQPVFVHARAFANRRRQPAFDAMISYELGSDARGRCCATNVRFADEKPSTRQLRFSAAPILLALSFLASLAFLAGSGRIPISVAVAYLVASLLTFMAYALDKSAAQSGQWRTQERTLFLMGLVGGWPGAVFAQQIFRHKSNKRDFQAIFWLTVIANAGALVWLLSPSGTDLRLLFGTMI